MQRTYPLILVRLIENRQFGFQVEVFYCIWFLFGLLVWCRLFWDFSLVSKFIWGVSVPSRWSLMRFDSRFWMRILSSLIRIIHQFWKRYRGSILSSLLFSFFLHNYEWFMCLACLNLHDVWVDVGFGYENLIRELRIELV